MRRTAFVILAAITPLAGCYQSAPADLKSAGAKGEVVLQKPVAEAANCIAAKLDETDIGTADRVYAVNRVRILDNGARATVYGSTEAFMQTYAIWFVELDRQPAGTRAVFYKTDMTPWYINAKVEGLRNAVQACRS